MFGNIVYQEDVTCLTNSKKQRDKIRTSANLKYHDSVAGVENRFERCRGQLVICTVLLPLLPHVGSLGCPVIRYIEISRIETAY